MAVEDGATLGILLGRLSRSPVIDPVNRAAHIPGVFKLYESLRKKRTTTNVQGAIQNRQLYHMVDGPECDARNEVFATVDWDRPDSNFPWGWANLKYLKDLMGFDTIADAAGHFDEWVVRGKE
jgi:salicylate hydroxylase